MKLSFLSRSYLQPTALRSAAREASYWGALVVLRICRYNPYQVLLLRPLIMSAVSVTSKGQVTIPKRVRDALGIAAGSKVEFSIKGAEARLTLVRKGAYSKVEDGAGILKYSGRRIPVSEMHGGVAMKKAFSRARR